MYLGFNNGMQVGCADGQVVHFTYFFHPEAGRNWSRDHKGRAAAGK